MSKPLNRIPCSIKCCLCGVDIPGGGASMCNKCLTNTVDMSEGIETEIKITYCKQCNRILTSSKHWVLLERESVEELGLMLKMIKGLDKSELVDAHFIWTEPHSRRIIIELELKKEIQNGLTVIGKTRVTFIQVMHLCDECYKIETENTWEAVVQLRQKVEHKRTLLWLEQHLVNTRRHADSIGVQIVSGGLDFYFIRRNEAIQFVEYIKKTLFCSVKYSSRLKYQDVKSNIGWYEHQYTVDLSPICKEDLVLLPRGSARDISMPLMICNKITSSLNFIHPATAKTISINPTLFSRYPFNTVLLASSMKEFTVLDVIPVDENAYRGQNRNSTEKYMIADIEVIRSDDFGVTDNSVIVRSHLGHLLQPGDLAMGYDLRTTVWNSDELDKYSRDVIPDVLLVKKCPDPDSKKSRKHKNRRSQFKEVKEIEVDDVREVEKYERDREAFLLEEEEDEEEEMEMDEMDEVVEVVDEEIIDDDDDDLGNGQME